MAFCVMMPRSLISAYQRYRRIDKLHLQTEGNDILLQNSDNHTKDYVTS
jgi:hypothetical protein